MQEIAATIQRDDAVLADRLISSVRQPYQDTLRQYYKRGISCTQMAKEEGITLSGMALRKMAALRTIRNMLIEN